MTDVVLEVCPGRSRSTGKRQLTNTGVEWRRKQKTKRAILKEVIPQLSLFQQ